MDGAVTDILSITICFYYWKKNITDQIYVVEFFGKY